MESPSTIYCTIETEESKREENQKFEYEVELKHKQKTKQINKQIRKTKSKTNDYNNESMNNEVKSMKKQNIRSKNKKQVKSNKNKTMARKNISYLDNIESLLKNGKIETDIINTIAVKQGDNLINVKSPTDEKSSEYWTISHYKVKNIKNVDSKNRWKETECSLKVMITDQAKDQELKNNLSKVVQTKFTRFMSDPKRKIVRSKLSKTLLCL